MKLTKTHFYEKLKTSLWFIPISMTLIGPVFAIIFFRLDLDLSNDKAFYTWLWTGSAEAANDLFSTLASSLVTMATLLFSITMLVLTVVSQQYGSHILRVFRRNLFMKFVLGWFISAFVYSLFVIVFLSTEDNPDLHPQISIVFGILIMVLSFIIFIVFIHHMTNLIQSDHIISAVTDGLRRKIEELEENAERPIEVSKIVVDKFHDESGIFLETSGYIQSIDVPYLVSLASKNETVFLLPHRAGHYVAKGVPVVFMPEINDDESFAAKVRNSFVLGCERLPKDDFEYHLEQLMEICLKALSPGMNDAYIAMTVIDHLGDALVMLSSRRFPPECHYDKNKMIRVISKRFTYDSFVSAAVNPIKQNARSNAQILIRLLDMIERVLGVTEEEEKRTILMEHADYIFKAGESGIPDKEDVAALRGRYDGICKEYHEG